MPDTNDMVSRSSTASDTHLRAVLDTVTDGIIQTINPATQCMFGYAAEKLVGENVKLQMPEVYAREHDGYINNYLASGKAKIIGAGRGVVGRRKDGSTFPLDLSGTEMHQGAQRFFVGVMRDIPDRRKIEDELHRQSAVLKAAAEQKTLSPLEAGVVG